MQNPETIFGSNVSAQSFFKDYWQKKPLLIRGAFANGEKNVQWLENLISAEEIAGYALDPDIESRLIKSQPSNNQWDLELGPLEETIFSELPENNWTLLVQSLDYFHPPLRQLIETCDFIPRWRLDDVMVSFATDQGGVGAHLDQYDVFLVQGAGKRRWRVGYKDQSVENFEPHPQIAQIKPFEADMDVEVTCGDVLYIPPNTPHWGESIGESICYSIGFRAPNIQAVSQKLLSDPATSENLWQDQDLLNAAMTSGALPKELNYWAKTGLELLFNKKNIQTAMGKAITELKYPEILDELNETPIDSCQANELSKTAFFKPFKLHPLARIAFFPLEDEMLQVFINGDVFEYDSSIETLIEALNYQKTIYPKDLSGMIGTSKTTVREFLTEALLRAAILLINDSSISTQVDEV